MPSLNTPGLRIVAAGIGAAALTLAAATPVLAQVGDGGFSSWLDTDQVLEVGYNEAKVGLGVPETATDGSITELEVVVTPSDSEVLRFSTWDGPVHCGANSDEDGGPHNGGATCRFSDENGVTEFPQTWSLAAVLTDTATTESDGSFTIEIFVNSAEAPVFSSTGEYDLAASFNGGEDGGEEPTDPPVEQDPNEVDEGTEYEFALLNYILEGANPGETLTGFPQVRVNSPSSADRAATVLWFEDSSDTDAWFENGEVEYTGAVEVIADYDNCTRIDYTVYCVLTDFDPQVGSTYTVGDDSPVLYEVLETVTDADGAAYGAYDINQAGLDQAADDGLLAPESDNRLSLVETDLEIEDKYFSDFWGFVFFAGDERGHGQVPSTDGGALPKTGSSLVVVMSAAAAAIAAGAIVFFMPRRRKVAQTWE